MPAPPAPLIIALSVKAVDEAGLKGVDAIKLAIGLGKAIATSLAQLVAGVQVLPGQPAAIDPITGSGATAGPGLLQGELSASAAEAHAKAELGELQGAGIAPLIKVYGAVLSQAAAQWVSGVMVAPGATIAGFTTAAPGPLLGAPPLPTALEPLCLAELDANEIKGEGSRWLARALASTLSGALALAMSMVMAAPGQSCAPGATAAPGRLM